MSFVGADWSLVFDEPIKQLDFSFGQHKFR